MSEIWKEIIGNDFDTKSFDKSNKILKNIEKNKQDVLSEEKRYLKKWNNLNKETKIKINKEVEEISKTRAYGHLALTKLIIKFEILDRN